VKKEIIQKPSTNWPFEIDKIESWAYFEKAFSKKECEDLIKIGKKQKMQKGLVGSENKLSKNRDCNISWIYPSVDTQKYFQKLTDIIFELNNKYFNFDLYGFSEGLQFTHYKQPNGSYGKHIDRGYNIQIRKLSFSVELSDVSSYEGGELNLYEGDKPMENMKKEQGTLIAFPSFMLHEVTPVTKGERFSLVAWLTGDPLK